VRIAPQIGAVPVQLVAVVQQRRLRTFFCSSAKKGSMAARAGGSFLGRFVNGLRRRPARFGRILSGLLLGDAPARYSSDLRAVSAAEPLRHCEDEAASDGRACLQRLADWHTVKVHYQFEANTIVVPRLFRMLPWV
jgi:hypothetical protein